MRATRFPPLCGGEGGGELARCPGGGEGGESGPPGPRFNPRDPGGKAELTETPTPHDLDVVGVARSWRGPSSEEEGEVEVHCRVGPTARAGR